MGKISPQDHYYINTMLEAGLLCNTHAPKLPAQNGVITIPCSDGDQMADVHAHQTRLFQEGGFPNRPHMPSLHGGSMLIAKECPLYRVADDGVTQLNADVLLLQHIREASSSALKGIRTVVLYVHAPCGAAGLAGLSFVHQVVYLMLAKERVKKMDPTLHVVCFVHIDFGDGRKHTYFISRDAFIEFWNTRGRELWSNMFETDPFPRGTRKRGDLGQTMAFDPALLNLGQGNEPPL